LWEYCGDMSERIVDVWQASLREMAFSYPATAFDTH